MGIFNSILFYFFYHFYHFFYIVLFFLKSNQSAMTILSNVSKIWQYVFSINEGIRYVIEYWMILFSIMVIIHLYIKIYSILNTKYLIVWHIILQKKNCINNGFFLIWFKHWYFEELKLIGLSFKFYLSNTRHGI